MGPEPAGWLLGPDKGLSMSDLNRSCTTAGGSEMRMCKQQPGI